LTTNVETKIKKEIFVKGKKGSSSLQSTILRDLWPITLAIISPACQIKEHGIDAVLLENT
jgi:hypothetical protein